MARPLLRVICEVHDGVLARVVDGGQGPLYEADLPILAGQLFVADRGSLTRGLQAKHNSRLPEAQERARVYLESEDAQRYAFGQQYRGLLPAWCNRCSETRWVAVDELRWRRGTIRI